MPSDGYGFVPLPPRVSRKRREHARFDRVDRRCMAVVLDISYVALEPVHVGSGFWTMRGDHAARGAVRSGEVLTIPGSSMKGALRARFEAITNSCTQRQAPSERRLDKKLPSRTYPGYQVEFTHAVRNHDVFTQCTTDQMCPACALFGRMSQRGRVSVRDLRVSEGPSMVDVELPKRFSPRPHHLGKFDRPKDGDNTLVVHTLHGRKFHVGSAPPPTIAGERAEAIARGAVVSGRIVCTNVTDAELGGLLSALGIEPRTELKIGAAKAHRFGRLALAGLQVDVKRRPDDFREEGFFDRVVASFRASEDYWADGERALVALYGRGAP